jgi:hypothetical protein
MKIVYGMPRAQQFQARYISPACVQPNLETSQCMWICLTVSNFPAFERKK